MKEKKGKIERWKREEYDKGGYKGGEEGKEKDSLRHTRMERKKAESTQRRSREKETAPE